MIYMRFIPGGTMIARFQIARQALQLEQIDELAVRDHRAVRIRLAADRQAQRIRVRRPRAGGPAQG
jgi:hypothetical protein